MATLTFPHSSFLGGAVVVEFDVNDANWRVSRVRCINRTDKPAQAFIYDNGVQVFVATAPAEQTTTWNVTGVQLDWDSVNGGIMMGTYSMSVVYPAGP